MQLLRRNYFELMALPASFRIDLPRLESAYRELQSAVHPDRFVNQPPAERRLAMQAATLANEAWRCLRDPVQRAVYLLRLNGVEVDETSRSGFEPGFLVQQMSWREALEGTRDAADPDRERAVLMDEVRVVRDVLVDELERLIDVDRRYELAAARVRQLMFIDRFLDQIDSQADESF
jgi:molecular chaperone HscB